MKLLALDISTKAGWAVISKPDDGPPALGPYGNKVKVKSAVEYGQYPRSYRLAAKAMADQLIELVVEHRPDVVVVEETNQGKNRWSQKLLEWIHLYFQQSWDNDPRLEGLPEAKYISTGEWKHALGISMNAVEKKNNERLRRARKKAEETGEPLSKVKKEMGVVGRISRKHVSVRFVNDLLGLSFKLKDNDIAEAIALGMAYFNNAPLCDGSTESR